MTFSNQMRTPIERDSEGYARVLDETANGSKAVPVVFVVKDSDTFGYGSEGDPDATISNGIKKPVETDAHGARNVVDEDIDGVKAIPLVQVTKNAEGKFEYKPLEQGGDVTWEDVQDKPSTFAPSDHAHEVGDITGLQTTLNEKLTANKAAAQSDSNAEDIETLVSDYNELLGKLRAAGILAE